MVGGADIARAPGFHAVDERGDAAPDDLAVAALQQPSIQSADKAQRRPGSGELYCTEECAVRKRTAANRQGRTDRAAASTPKKVNAG